DAPLEAGGRIALTGSAARHLTRVLRLRPGQALTLFNGGGGQYAATIEAVHGEKVEVAVGEAQAIERESPLSLTLAQGVSRGERMDLVVQKATELGASSIVPLLTERSVVRFSAPPAPRASMRYRARPTPSPCSSAPRADSLTPSSRRPWRRASSRCASVPGCCAPRQLPSPRLPCCSGSSGICRGSGRGTASFRRS